MNLNNINSNNSFNFLLSIPDSNSKINDNSSTSSSTPSTPYTPRGYNNTILEFKDQNEPVQEPIAKIQAIFNSVTLRDDKARDGEKFNSLDWQVLNAANFYEMVHKKLTEENWKKIALYLQRSVSACELKAQEIRSFFASSASSFSKPFSFFNKSPSNSPTLSSPSLSSSPI